jgi:hypothetical protein
LYICFEYTSFYQVEKEKKIKGTHGGAREGGGRKPKAEEERVRKLGLNAIIEVYGSEELFWARLASESVKSFPHKKLLMEYLYGKPKEKIEIDAPASAIPVMKWATEENDRTKS